MQKEQKVMNKRDKMLERFLVSALVSLVPQRVSHD